VKPQLLTLVIFPSRYWLLLLIINLNLCSTALALQCFDAVGWAAARASVL